MRQAVLPGYSLLCDAIPWGQFLRSAPNSQSPITSSCPWNSIETESGGSQLIQNVKLELPCAIIEKQYKYEYYKEPSSQLHGRLPSTRHSAVQWIGLTELRHKAAVT